MPKWFWQGLLVNGVYALLILGGGAVMAILYSKLPEIYSMAAKGLVGSASVAVIIFCYLGILNRPKRLAVITPENAEENVKAWIEKFNLTHKRVEDASVLWAYLVTLNDGNSILVMRRKDRDKYVYFQGNVVFAPEHLLVYKTLSPVQSNRLAERLALQLAQTYMTFNLIGVDATPGFAISTRIPITAGMTEDEVMLKIDQTDAGMIIGKVVIRQYLEEVEAANQQS